MATTASAFYEESPQPEIIRNLPQPPILMGAGPAHMVVYARNKVRVKEVLWFHKAHDTRNLNALMDCRLLCLTHFVVTSCLLQGNVCLGKPELWTPRVTRKEDGEGTRFRCPQRTGCVENCLCQGLQSLVW